MADRVESRRRDPRLNRHGIPSYAERICVGGQIAPFRTCERDLDADPRKAKHQIGDVFLSPAAHRVGGRNQ